MQQDDRLTSTANDSRHTHVLDNCSPATHATSYILSQGSELLAVAGTPLQPQFISLNRALFTPPLPGGGIAEVEVGLEDKRLQLHCRCTTPTATLCMAQAQVLYALLNRRELRVFFDAELRHQAIREVAREYGLEGEKALDPYFELALENRELSIRPRQKGLISFNSLSEKTIGEQLLPLQPPALSLPSVEDRATMIVVLSQHRFYNHLNLELFCAASSREGKPKNPLRPVAPLDLIWKTDCQQELKFYAAIQKFQHNYQAERSVSDIQGLKAMLENPLGLAFYMHDARVSTACTAASLQPVQLKSLSPELRLYVHQKGDFYEVSGELVIADKAHALNSLKIRYHYFVLVGATLYLIDKLAFLSVIDFFRQYNYTLLIHHSKFEAFRKSVLSQLEHRVRIHYSYYRPATPKQLQEAGYSQEAEQLIYLSDSEEWVLISPVMRYGEVEIPILSKKQLYALDAKGTPFAMERDDAAELAFLARLIQQHPDFKEQLYQEGSYIHHDCFYLHRKRFLDEHWFLDAFDAWQEEGIRVLGFNQLSRNRLNPHKAKVSVQVHSGVDWFDTHLQVTFGGQKASLKHLQKALRNRSRFVQLGDGSQGVLPAEWLERFRAYFQAGEVVGECLQSPKSSFRGIRELYEEEVLSAEVVQELALFEQKLANIGRIGELSVPARLNAYLRDYQKQGLNWLNFLDEGGFGGCLADDMGLGKTLQILAFILAQGEKIGNTPDGERHNCNLVVVPTTLIFNWQAEVAKFAPSLRVLTLWGPGRIRDPEIFSDYEIILTSYGTLLQDIRFLKQFRFNYLFLDESQAIKNPESQRYKAARLLQARNRIVITGTPLENNTFDLYSQLSFACPGLLGNKQYFKEQFSARIDKFNDSRKARELQHTISPFILRRSKEQVAPELPDKTEITLFCEMGPEQRRVYNAYAREFRDFLLSRNEGDLDRNSLHVLQGLTKLRQICNAPALLNDSQFYSHASAKIEVLMEQIENKAPQHKILVFSQFVSMLELVKAALRERSISFEYLTGKTRNRQARVAKFQGDEGVRVFLISLKAGGTGLNLTEADYVYLVDPWWNPAVENQAIDRTHRIGQQKKVVAVRLICPDTIEEKVMRLQEAKAALARDLIQSNENGLPSLSREELLGLLDG